MSIPEEFLRDLDPSERTVIQRALTANTAEANRAQVASQIYLAHHTRTAGARVADAVGALAGALERAFADHARALQAAATSSARYARGLTRATWALVAATIGLVLATVVQVWRGH